MPRLALNLNTLPRSPVRSATNVPSARQLPLLYADRGLIVLNKPSGLICQSNKVWQRDGRKCGFDELLQDLKRQFGLDEVPKQVHRLDKNTTGAYLFAKTDVHARALSQQFREHSVKKTYIAIVRGGRKSFPFIARGTISVPLSVEHERTVVDERNGRATLTDWELLGSSETVPLSLLRLSLHSGIKHQLRVHLARELEAPILGDVLYSSKAPTKSILDIIPKGVNIVSEQTPASGSESGSVKRSPRLFLHSSYIELTRYRSSGPSKRVRLGISAPIPSYFWAVCQAVGLSRYVPPEYRHGGLFVDGVPVSLHDEVAGLEGKWLGPLRL